MTGQGRTGRGTAGQRDTATGNKSVIFHLVYKQLVMLRWAIAYYGLRPACDISKQSRTALCERLGWTNEECVLTSRRGLLGVWTSSSLGNPGRQCTCYGWAWEQTRGEHLSSCLVRHKLWIMNITEVMGLWDSFITLTNTISQEGWGGRTRQPYACLFCFAKQAVELFNSAAWLLSHLYLALPDPCCCGKWASIFRPNDSACGLGSRWDRGREAAGMWGNVSDVTQMTVWALWNMSPTLFKHKRPVFDAFFKTGCPPQPSQEPARLPFGQGCRFLS